jgi:hypothetical protein
MRRILTSLILFITCAICVAQTTAVTATITDSDSTVWINANYSVTFSPNPNFPNLNSYSIAGVPITSSTYIQYVNQQGTTNGSGVLSVTLLDSSQISPGGSKWYFVVQPLASFQATTYTPVAVSGASQSLTSFLSSNSRAPRFPAINNAFGYADVEISTVPNPGGSYFNTTNLIERQWNGTTWTNSGGGSSIASAQLTMPVTAISGGTCTTTATVTMTGLVAPSGTTPGTTIKTIFESNPEAVTGWGASGGVNFVAWVSAANTLSWSVCNPTASSITPGAMKIDVGA